MECNAIHNILSTLISTDIDTTQPNWIIMTRGCLLFYPFCVHAGDKWRFLLSSNSHHHEQSQQRLLYICYNSYKWWEDRIIEDEL